MALARLKQEYLHLKRDPVQYITAEPSPANILEWHYVIKGPEDSPYYGGYYHGTLLFPPQYPFKAPAIFMLTPSGRFKIRTRLCLSISDYHPETWDASWRVGTILMGLLSFMMESTPTIGSIETGLSEKQQLAKRSLAFNLKNKTFVELFPEICKEIKAKLQSEKDLKLKATNAEITEKGAGTNNTNLKSEENVKLETATSGESGKTNAANQTNVELRTEKELQLSTPSVASANNDDVANGANGKPNVAASGDVESSSTIV
ncbi:ubiquitin-conjugating enzyme E2 J2 [Musca domestica]|uniref:Ubiquitin-conjugating enzyme E2 J2 n=1 Tax=Musca domestica TaxID=7370 RepID=A0A1I8MES9_MUSDO|nr:ubiquitin-conjugating enzyme E2 J2 [Musca domestica]